MNDDERTILRIVARDIESILAPCIESPNVRFIAGTMKSLLDRIALSLPGVEGTAAIQRPDDADWRSLIRWAEGEEARVLAGEQTSRESAWSQSGSGNKEAGASAGMRTGPIQAPQLLAYLKDRSGPSDAFAWIEQLTINQAPGGFSKDTFLVRMRGGGREEGMVLRRDQSFRPLLTSVADETEVLRTLSAAGFPVPKPLWLETDPQHFGAAVLATSWLEGSADSARWVNDQSTARRVLTDAAELLARLHAYPTGELKTQGSGVPGSRGSTPAALVEDLAAFWNTIRPAPNPLMERVLHWLLDHAPADFARRAIVHADFGFHNLLVSGAQITGLLDWEFWHLGDAREDLAYARSFVQRVMPWDDFRVIYESAGGIASDPAVDRFYSVIGGTRVAMGCYALQHALRHAADQLDSKMVYVSQSFANRFLIDAAKVAAGAEASGQ